MGKSNMIGASAFDNDNDDVEGLVEQFDSYIVAFVKQSVLSSSNFAHPAVLDLEIDEIAQGVRIRFWQKLQKEHIEHPKAYIRRMVHNTLVDAARRRKPPLPLPVDDEGELYQRDVLVTWGAGIADPADAVEQEEALAERMAQVAGAVAELPGRQRQAMVYLLKTRLEDSLRMLDAFAMHQLDVKSIHWPDDEAEVHRLQASIAPARRTLAQSMGVELPERKKRGVPNTPLFCTEDVEAFSCSSSSE